LASVAGVVHQDALNHVQAQAARFEVSCAQRVLDASDEIWLLELAR
jgi:hypothetical protein